MGADPATPVPDTGGDLLIDFRYHLISLIAVFLALGLGILMGSVVLEKPLIDHLERRVAQIQEANDTNRGEISRLNDRLDGLEGFVAGAQRTLTAGELIGDDVLIVSYERSDEDSLEALQEAISGADGEVVGTITVTDAMTLPGTEERERLDQILGQPSDSAEAARSALAARLGRRLARSVAEDGPGGVAGRLLRRLEEAGFVGLGGEGPPVLPPGTLVLVFGGAEDEPPYEIATTNLRFSGALAAGGARVLVAETAPSTWGLVTAIRDEGTVSTQVSTVDNADTTAGRIATVLGIDLASQGAVDHYGFGEDADPFPQLSPAG